MAFSHCKDRLNLRCIHTVSRAGSIHLSSFSDDLLISLDKRGSPHSGRYRPRSLLSCWSKRGAALFVIMYIQPTVTPDERRKGLCDSRVCCIILADRLMVACSYTNPAFMNVIFRMICLIIDILFYFVWFLNE